MKLHEIKKDYLEILRQRYQDLYKTVKFLKKDIDSTREKVMRIDEEELDVAEYLEDLSDVLDTAIKKHNKPMF